MQHQPLKVSVLLFTISHFLIFNYVFAIHIVKSTITRSSGFIPGIPSGNILTVGADTCLPPPGHSLRIRCQTTPTVPVMWTLNSNPVTGDEFVDVNSAGTYTCSGTDNCGRSLSASSEIIGNY